MNALLKNAVYFCSVLLWWKCKPFLKSWIYDSYISSYWFNFAFTHVCKRNGICITFLMCVGFLFFFFLLNFFHKLQQMNPKQWKGLFFLVVGFFFRFLFCRNNLFCALLRIILSSVPGKSHPFSTILNRASWETKKSHFLKAEASHLPTCRWSLAFSSCALGISMGLRSERGRVGGCRGETAWLQVAQSRSFSLAFVLTDPQPCLSTGPCKVFIPFALTCPNCKPHI